MNNNKDSNNNKDEKLNNKYNNKNLIIEIAVIIKI